MSGSAYLAQDNKLEFNKFRVKVKLHRVRDKTRAFVELTSEDKKALSTEAIAEALAEFVFMLQESDLPDAGFH